jgi:hypothetical protein
MVDKPIVYIEIPRSDHRTVRIGIVLEQRMREFMLMRRRKIWQEEGR